MTKADGPADQPPERPQKRGSRGRSDPEPTVDPLALLNYLLKNAVISQNPQTDEERTSKLAIAEKDAEHKRSQRKAVADHRRRLELIALLALLAIAALVCPVCLWVLTDKRVSLEQKQWAAPLLTFVFGGLIGYLTGRVPAQPPVK